MVRNNVIVCLLLAMFSGLLTSCVYDDGPENIPDKEKEYGFCFRIRTTVPIMSRAADVYDETGTVYENMLDMYGDDIRIMLFSGKDNGARLIATPEFKISVENDRYTEYIVWTSIPESFFETNGITPGQDKDYTLVVLANWKSRGGSYPATTQGVTTVSDIENSNGRFLTGHNPEGWSPFENGNGGIPMYGKLSFRERKESLFLQMDDDGNLIPNNDTPLYMLRAMAKIEVIDRTGEAIGNPDETLNPWIESVRVDYYNQNGYAVPSEFVNGEQVNSATIPNQNGEVYVDGNDGVYNLNKKDKLFYAYLMEQSQNNLYLRFFVKKRNQNGEIVTKDYYLRVRDMIEQQTYKQAFLRNHIYRIYVTLDTNANISLRYVVCPWVEKTAGDITFD